ncbi:XdhC family aldehyde oxidoreductase maturation factor [Desulfonema magnum]|uniref:XdhC domains-containing protein n=1 Tax=Desulfonema magnum TaxID=45655 RepID=A0A975GSD6_9BACT|nr:XdhC/CoxI family protein [Desulfonema magnum]QTA91950.1 XdhC domains-containing protein [Desulfonema magnum]
MSRLEQSIYQMIENGESVVLATILSRVGSTPRTAGTKMLIRSDGKIIGTIGGGLVEAQVMKTAPEIFKSANAQVRIFDLTASENAESVDMICGGRLEILLELIEPNPVNLEIFGNLLTFLQKRQKTLIVSALKTERGELKKVERCLLSDHGITHGDLSLSPSLSETLVKETEKERAPVTVTLENQKFVVEPYFTSGTVFLFGAGHVSQKVGFFSKMVDFRTVVLDDREEFANQDRFKDADEIIVLDSFEQALKELTIDKDSYVVIVTRGHNHDKTVLAQSLRTNAGYIGMIGSRQKRDTIYKALLSEGFTSEDLKRVHSPIGLSIGAETPHEIAISIISELIAARAGVET